MQSKSRGGNHKVEKIQRTATRIPIKNIIYEDRSKNFGITALDERWRICDLIYMFKLTKENE